jgi:hypothetical protein
MTYGERQQIPTDALLAAARMQAEQTRAPRITIPLPSARAVKTVAWWTLGIALGICAMPFVLWGLSSVAWAIAALFYPPQGSAHAVVWLVLMIGTMSGTHLGMGIWMCLRDRRVKAEKALRAEIATAVVERRGATLH